MYVRLVREAREREPLAKKRIAGRRILERRILRVLAGEPGVEPTSTAARERYGLGAPSTVATLTAAPQSNERSRRGEWS